MDKRSLLITSAIAGLLAVSTVASQTHSPKLDTDKEKCVGVGAMINWCVKVEGGVGFRLKE